MYTCTIRRKFSVTRLKSCGKINWLHKSHFLQYCTRNGGRMSLYMYLKLDLSQSGYIARKYWVASTPSPGWWLFWWTLVSSLPEGTTTGSRGLLWVWCKDWYISWLFSINSAAIELTWLLENFLQLNKWKCWQNREVLFFKFDSFVNQF